MCMIFNREKLTDKIIIQIEMVIYLMIFFHWMIIKFNKTSKKLSGFSILETDLINIKNKILKKFKQ